MAINKLPTSASLKQLIDKFEEISLQDFSNIDIITASELPSEGKENRICIITDVEPISITVNSTGMNTSMEESAITMKLSPMEKIPMQEIKSSNKTIFLSYEGAYQYVGGNLKALYGYIYKDGVWELLTVGVSVAFKDGMFLNTPIFGSFNIYSSSSTATGVREVGVNTNKELEIKTTKSTDEVQCRFSNKIDLTGFSSLVVDISGFTVNSAKSTCFLSINVSDGTNVITSKKHTTTELENQKWIIDLSNINMSCYIEVWIGTNETTGGAQSKGTCVKIKSLHIE
jgi:hypothetical protein